MSARNKVAARHDIAHLQCARSLAANIVYTKSVTGQFINTDLIQKLPNEKIVLDTFPFTICPV